MTSVFASIAEQNATVVTTISQSHCVYQTPAIPIFVPQYQYQYQILAQANTQYQYQYSHSAQVNTQYQYQYSRMPQSQYQYQYQYWSKHQYLNTNTNTFP